MRNKKGQFIKGAHGSKDTEFKKGNHWRNPKPYWEKDWLIEQYCAFQKSAQEIAKEQDCSIGVIYHFLRRHGIQKRTTSEARAIKYWGSRGEENGMYGRTGEDSSNWKGGITPERQSFYSSELWKKTKRSVWKRDGGICQRCGKRYDGSERFDIHHIISFCIEEKRADKNNLLVLCNTCHRWTHSKKNKNGEFLNE